MSTDKASVDVTINELEEAKEPQFVNTFKIGYGEGLCHQFWPDDPGGGNKGAG